MNYIDEIIHSYYGEKEKVTQEFSNYKELENTPDILKFLEEKALSSNLLPSPSKDSFDLTDYKNFGKKWEIDNPNILTVWDVGAKTTIESLNTTYYKQNLFDINNGSLNSEIENNQYLIRSFFRGNVIGFDKRREKYFPIWIEGCSHGCNKDLSFLDEVTLQIEYSEADNQKIIINLETMTYQIINKQENFDKKASSSPFDWESNTWIDFKGKLGKSNIQLSLFRFENGLIKGNYCYTKYEKKIQITGKVIGDKIELTEFLNDKVNGHFTGKVFTDNLDRFEGVWSNQYKTKSLEFKLSLQSMAYSDYKHRYNELYGSDDEIEKFMKRVKNSIQNGDKEWIADNICYPISIKLSGNNQINIENKNQFIMHYDQIFHQKFKNKISASCICNMFTNSQGVMLGDGEIWINNTLNSSSSNYNFCIIALNN